ncbi:MAG TPA: TetR/AcrR family transcriptional regulator, partial [Acidimicrobiales bacterium]|nr:TetR/AcrR family transcriptional regulator [Acidimicrobiales bacterium]
RRKGVTLETAPTGDEGPGDRDPRPRQPGRPRDPGYDRAILDATLQVLLDKGYKGLTIDGVAAKTGIGRPTIYRRWPSKPALVIAALAQSVGLSPTPDTGALRSDLLAFQRQQVRLMDSPESRRTTAGLVADLVADPELGEVYFRDYIAPRRESMKQALQRAVNRGELRADADFDLIYDMLLGPLFMRSVVRGEALGLDMVERTVEVVLTAFGNPTTPRRGSRPTRKSTVDTPPRAAVSRTRKKPRRRGPE